jgi:6-phosphogluconate dehydrogenase
MAGGDQCAFDMVEPLLVSLTAPGGYAYTGASGSGHFVKMVHNGIEYGMLQAYAEGFEILHAKKEFDLDLAAIARLWDHGSVIRYWLLELSEAVFREDPSLETVRGYVEDTGEGRWTVAEAVNENVSAPVITLSLLERIRSREQDPFSARVIAALRNKFGGHVVRKAV